MRILLQQIQTGCFLSQSGVWSPGSSEAADFLSSSVAIEYCIANGLSDVQLVLKFPEQRYEIVIPLLPLQEMVAIAQNPLSRADCNPA
jgi:hypothetical protein